MALEPSDRWIEVKYLRYRYELSERALYHHAKVAGDAVIAKLLEMWGDAEWVAEARARFLQLEGVGAADIDEFRGTVKTLPDADLDSIDGARTTRLDEEFTKWSDDGLLEHLRREGEERGKDDERWAAIGELACAVLDRQLCKPLGWADGHDARAVSGEIYRRYRGPDDRRRLERDAAFFAGLNRRFHVVLWVPDPDMKLKVAEVLVDADGQIMPLSRYNAAGDEIVRAHRQLWAVGVYVHPSVRDDERRGDAVLSYLADRMGVCFRRHDGSPVLAPRELVVAKLADDCGLNGAQRADLGRLVPAAKDAPGTYEGLEQVVRALAESNGLILPSSQTS